MHTVKRARLLTALAMTAAAGLLAGVSGCAASGDDKKTLVVWDYGVGYGGTEANQAAFYKLVDTINAAFEKANPGVTVSEKHFGYDDYDSKVAAAVAAGNAPDVAWAYTDVNWKVTLPLDSMMSDAQKSDLTLVDGQIQAAKDGKPHMMPWGTYQGIWQYNKAIFDKYGIQVPQTQDELLAACDKLNAAGIVPMRQTFAGGYSMDRMVAVTAGQTVGDITKWNQLETPFTSKGYRAGVDAFMEMTKHGCWGPNPASKGVPGESEQDFRASKTAMLYATQQIYVDDMESSIGKGNLGVFLQPAIPGGTANMDASAANGFTIPKSTKNKDLAWKYISFYLDAKQQQRAWDSIKQLPNLKSLKVSDSNPVYAQQLKWAADPQFHIGAWPITSLELDTYDQLTPEVVSGRMSVDDMLTKLQDAREQSKKGR